MHAERFAGSHGEDNAMSSCWYLLVLRVLHFKRAQPSFAGNYMCVASYSGNIDSRQSVEIRVLGE